MNSRPSRDREFQAGPVRTDAGPSEARHSADDELEARVRERTEELVEAQRRTAAALDSVNEGFVILDRDWRFAFANAAAERFILKSREELLGKSQWELFPEASHRRFGVEYRRAVGENVPVHFEEFYPAPLNRWFEVRAYPSAEGLSIFFSDITERRESDRALAESEAALQRVNEQLHATNAELRSRNETLEERVTARTADLMHRTTQLQALAGELARAEEHERRRVAQVIHDHLQQLLVVARMNLGILRGQARQAQTRSDLQQIDEVISEALEAARTLTAELSPAVLYRSGLAAALRWLSRWYREKHGMTVELETDYDADAQPEEVRITLYRSVSELLFNVVKHAKVQHAQVHLGRTADGRTEIVVSDAGAGFDPTKVRAREGSAGGFGLFNLRERLESLGGRLEIESAPGDGTRITIVSPRPAPPSVAPPPTGPGHRAVGGRRKGAAGRGRIRILLADDHAVVRDGLIRAFRNDPSLEVVGQAGNGHEALTAARELRPDVVLMDVAMPKLDGIEATRLLKIELPDVKVIGLSMFDDDTHGAEMRGAGAVGFVHKTAPTDTIVQAIHEHAGVPPAPARKRRAPKRA